jgi:DNA-binding transcriptional LysR family regulator
VELRDIEIFLTLAEELHFGRTAERLRVTPSRVSQAIRKQERRIGAMLFERNNRVVRLTPIGEQLFDDLRLVHRGLNESLARASLAARGKTEVLRLGMIGGFVQEDLRPLFDAFAVRRPECSIQIRNVGFDNPFGPLRTGEADLEVLWLPVREPDLAVGPVIYTEPLVLAMAAGHPLAGRESVSYEVLGDEVVMGGCVPEYWRGALVPSVTPGGRPITVGPTATNFLEMLPILSTGEAMSPIMATAARYYLRPDIAYVPIHDAPQARWALIWRAAAETDLVRAFVETARDHAGE